MEMEDWECLALRAILLRALMAEGKFAGFMSWIVALALLYSSSVIVIALNWMIQVILPLLPPTAEFIGLQAGSLSRYSLQNHTKRTFAVNINIFHNVTCPGRNKLIDHQCETNQVFIGRPTITMCIKDFIWMHNGDRGNWTRTKITN